MVTQADFPEKWVCESDSKEAIVEVRTDHGTDVRDEVSSSTFLFGDDDDTFSVEIGFDDDSDIAQLSSAEIQIYTLDTGSVVASLDITDFEYAETSNGEPLYTTTLTYNEIGVENGTTVQSRVLKARTFSWIEIPTTEVELWEEKGDAASRQRTARVEFPTEWGEVDDDDDAEPTAEQRGGPSDLVVDIERYTFTTEDELRVNVYDEEHQRDTEHIYTLNIELYNTETGDVIERLDIDDFELDTTTINEYRYTTPYDEIAVPIENIDYRIISVAGYAWQRAREETGHNSPRQLIDRFDPNEGNPFMFGRVSFKDRNDNFVLKHLGWIGGIGAAEGNNRSKMWIYDFAEFLSGVPAGVEFNQPTVTEAVSEIRDLILNNTSIPMSQIRLIEPETEEEASRLAEGALAEDNIRGASDVLAGTVSAFNGVTSLFGTDLIDKETRVEDDTVFYRLEAGLGPVTTETNELQEEFETLIINTEGSFGPIETNSKHFRANHDTLLDIIKWFEEKTEASIHFEPRPSGESVQMVVDIVPTRRTFADKAVISRAVERGTSLTFTEPITVTKNTALYEMKPQNTLHLRGSYPNGVLDTVVDKLEGATDLLTGNSPSAQQYPVVKAQIPSLVQAANGVELSGEVVESDATSEEAARKEAKSKLSEQMSETSAGEIVMYGKPRLMPYEKVIAYEVCNGQVAYEQTPVEYEVQSVKHTASGSDRYLSRVTVSIFANNKNIEIIEDETGMVDVNN